ncbi:MAG: ParB N-terminal domain-containing protein [Hyphomicrobiales bacterium]|nr:ParB N-terminal domain-containing protein [Hyphomicrobiales bacterium]MDE2115069.1 ParB N-terminal domain-containing protein [Hyphomicrobiales bacterium]
MTKAINKITMSSSRDIPFNQLVLSQANIRRVKAGMSIEELAEDIARRTLLQSLNVRPVLDAQGVETGMFEIPAGGRRYRALELLVKQKRLAKNAPIPCVVRDATSSILMEDDSLAENIQRAPLHPLDQFRAFACLRDKGQSEDEIAAAFFVSVNVVKQRLRLAAVSPKLLEAYEAGDMKLEQLMAFTVSPDYARQEQVWSDLANGWNKEPFVIRRHLTEGAVSASDKRALFIGIEAYEQAGGVILRDLFDERSQGWFTDVALLDRLTAEKLRTSATSLSCEGWKWVEAHVSIPYGITKGMRMIEGTPIPLSDEEKAKQESLVAEYEALETEYADVEDLPEAVAERLEVINKELALLDNRPLIYDPADMAMAGAFMSLNHDGNLIISRGYVRACDEPQQEAHTSEADSSDSAGQATPAHAAPDNRTHGSVIVHGETATQANEDEEDDDAIKPLSDRLLSELSASRTLALRHAVAHDEHIAMTVLLHRLVLDGFFHHGFDHCVEIGLKQVYLTHQPEDVQNSPAAKALDLAHQNWKSQMPQDAEALWDWINEVNAHTRQSLLAHCVALSINALYEKSSTFGQNGVTARLKHADRLARAVKLDMVAAQWQPTVANYLGRVPKHRILEAVREAKGEGAVQLIEHLKKPDMAREAERLLQNSQWLPEVFRMNDAEIPLVIDEADQAVDALPEFLSDEDGADLDDEPHAIAAE